MKRSVMNIRPVFRGALLGACVLLGSSNLPAPVQGIDNGGEGGNPPPPTYYHVRADGSDSTCDGTENYDATNTPHCAFATPQKAWDTLLASGNTSAEAVQIHRGTYSVAGRICPRGALLGVTALLCMDAGALKTAQKVFSTQAIVEGAPNESVTFEGGGSIATGIIVYNVSNVLIRKIAFHDFTGESTVEFSENGAAINISTNTGKSANDIVIDGISSTGHTSCPIGGSTPLESNADIVLSQTATSLRNVLKNSYVETWCDQGLYIGRGCCSSTSFNHKVLNNTFIKKATAGRQLIIRGHNSENVEINGNYILVDSSGHGEDQGMEIRNSLNWTVTNNVVQMPKGYLINSFDNESSDVIEHHEFTNNTLDGLGGIGNIGFYTLGNPGCDECIVRNNIFMNIGVGIRLQGDGGLGGTNTTVGYSLFYNNGTNLVNNTTGGYDIDTRHDRSGNPHFMASGNKPSPYFIPMPTSPAIDTGETVSCAHRRYGDECEIGALEYVP
jgi:hypothetical protein